MWLPLSGAGLPLILAASDGHGSARYFRSDAGARLAVETAAEVLSAFVNGQDDFNNLSVTKHTAEEWLPRAVVRRWREAVAEHLHLNPFNADESDAVEIASGSSATARQTDTSDFIAYGATLLVVVVSESFILYMQLGDGRIVCVSEKGEVTLPLPADERLFANETTSLCAEEAWRDFRICFQTISQTPPSIILLTTDGYANSFRDESAFLKVGADIFEMIHNAGLDSVRNSLQDWLTESTRIGSGDDVTLGIICHTDVFSPSPTQALPEQMRNEEIKDSRFEI